MITIPSSEYFTLHPIKAGVYAAVAKEGSPNFSNAGIIDIGDQILVFDTFNTYRAAEDLRRDTEILTRRLVDYVVISHAHSDHWLGNQVFADHAKLLATRPTQDAMMEWAEYFRELQSDDSECEAYIDEIEKDLATATDSRLRKHLAWSLAVEKHRYAVLETTELHIPNNALSSKLDIYGADAIARVFSLGAAHSWDDTILVLPDSKIAFLGDLGFFNTHPYLGDSDPQRWITILDELIASKIRVFVPGHGPVGTKNNLKALKEYILTLKSLATDVFMRGGSEDAAAAQPVPEFAANWSGLRRFERSMRFLYRQLKYKGQAENENDSRVLKSETYQLNDEESNLISSGLFGINERNRW